MYRQHVRMALHHDAMIEHKEHFIRVAREIQTTEPDVAEKLYEGLRRQIFEMMRKGFLTVDEVTEINDALPEGALYFSGSLLHDETGRSSRFFLPHRCSPYSSKPGR